MELLEVAFYLPDEPLETLRWLDPDDDWREFVRGERAWILQTYLRLRRAGHPVALVGELPGSGPIVYHRKHERRVLESLLATPSTQRTLIAVRGDRHTSRWADVQIVQNATQARSASHFFAPHWPQPGLLPRQTERGATIRQVAFKGFVDNLNLALRSPDWSDFLARRGIAWQCDAVAFHDGVTGDDVHWNDYRETDLIVALRADHDPAKNTKPATKLFNAWAAGAPALLGPEIAFRALRRSPFDYLEISDLTDAMVAVDRLVSQPDLYRAMVENGRRRALEYRPEAITDFWADLLWRRLPSVLSQRPRGAFRAWEKALQFVGLELIQKRLARPGSL